MSLKWTNTLRSTTVAVRLVRDKCLRCNRFTSGGFKRGGGHQVAYILTWSDFFFFFFEPAFFYGSKWSTEGWQHIDGEKWQNVTLMFFCSSTLETKVWFFFVFFLKPASVNGPVLLVQRLSVSFQVLSVDTLINSFAEYCYSNQGRSIKTRKESVCRYTKHLSGEWLVNSLPFWCLEKMWFVLRSSNWFLLIRALGGERRGVKAQRSREIKSHTMKQKRQWRKCASDRLPVLETICKFVPKPIRDIERKWLTSIELFIYY